MRKIRWPSPAFVVAIAALFVALGGTAVAAAPYLPLGSPAGGDLAGTYPNPRIAANAVGSAQVVNGSLRSDDIAVAEAVVASDIPELQPGQL